MVVSSVYVFVFWLFLGLIDIWCLYYDIEFWRFVMKCLKFLLLGFLFVFVFGFMVVVVYVDDLFDFVKKVGVLCVGFEGMYLLFNLCGMFG